MSVVEGRQHTVEEGVPKRFSRGFKNDLIACYIIPASQHDRIDLQNPQKTAA
jgi:hypothetical protein